jgi:hypothetical protein
MWTAGTRRWLEARRGFCGLSVETMTGLGPREAVIWRLADGDGYSERESLGEKEGGGEGEITESRKIKEVREREVDQACC